MAYNTSYIMLGTEPVARYVKTVPTSITAWRFDESGKVAVECLIDSDDPVESYDNAVIELYSDREHDFFKKKNKVLFTEGMIKPYDGSPAAVNTANYMSDADVLRVASIRTANKLQEAIGAIDSQATLGRILLQAEELGMTKRMRDIIEARMVSTRSGV